MYKILYIEDTENNRILVTRRLEKKGYKVLTAEAATAGLALAEAEKPDLILMDMGMPDIDGWSATRMAKSNPALNRIPIIALTAHAMQGDREKALAAGCDDYETKPFDFPRLFQKIEEHIRARRNTGSAGIPAGEAASTTQPAGKDAGVAGGAGQT
jgi:two-component system, cell cycle response regulator DivK